MDLEIKIIVMEKERMWVWWVWALMIEWKKSHSIINLDVYLVISND